MSQYKSNILNSLSRRKALEILSFAGGIFFISVYKSYSKVITLDSSGNIIKRQLLNAKYFTENLGNGVTLEMAQIPGGEFLMGSPLNEEGRYENESPQHKVTVKPFFMGKFAITQAQYEAIMGKNPSSFRGDKHPVHYVTWNEAIEFCRKLTEKTGRTYRLPSEAEWEYACRAGTTTPFHFGETIVTEIANYRGTDWNNQGTLYPGNYGSGPKGKYRDQIIEVGSFPPNAFGLYDMHGNIWELCEDIYQNNYNGAPIDGSAWSDNNSSLEVDRVIRGGSFSYNPEFCRSAFRSDFYGGGSSAMGVGFRVVCVFRKNFR